MLIVQREVEGKDFLPEHDSEALYRKDLCRLHWNNCNRIFKVIFLAQFSLLPLNALDRMGLFFTCHLYRKT